MARAMRHKRKKELTQPCRLLKLPRELRDQIYSCFLEDKWQKILDLQHWKEYFPNPTLKAICRQIRSETLSLYEHAKAEFWRSHQWAVYTDNDLIRKKVRQDLIRSCDDVPPSARIKLLELNLIECKGSRPPKEEPDVLPIEVGVGTNGRVEWRLGLPLRNPDTQILVARFSRKFDKAICRVAREQNLLLELVEDPGFLNIQNCIQTFCKAYVDPRVGMQNLWKP